MIAEGGTWLLLFATGFWMVAVIFWAWCLYTTRAQFHGTWWCIEKWGNMGQGGSSGKLISLVQMGRKVIHLLYFSLRVKYM